MRSVWGVYIPAGAKDFPGPIALRKQLRRCSCGQMTFLPLPCRSCGAQRSEPAFRWALRRAWVRRAGRWGLAAVYLLAAGCAALRIWPPLAVLIAGGTAAVLAADVIRSTAEGDICFWLFHDSARGKKKLPLANAARIGALTDAYDADLRRLERMLETDRGPECAERVFYMAQDLTQVFHNRRVSAVLAGCLTALPLSEGICVDLDQVCAWLEPEDVSAETLAKLAECARFTCLPAGEPTARFVCRFCALRFQEALKKKGLENSYTIWDMPQLSASGAASLRRAIPSKQERACLSALWNLAAVYLAPRTACPSGGTEAAAESGYSPDRWAWEACGNPGGPVFREIDRLLCDRLGASLKKKWRKERAE